MQYLKEYLSPNFEKDHLAQLLEVGSVHFRALMGVLLVWEGETLLQIATGMHWGPMSLQELDGDLV